MMSASGKTYEEPQVQGATLVSPWWLIRVCPVCLVYVDTRRRGGWEIADVAGGDHAGDLGSRTRESNHVTMIGAVCPWQFW